MISALVTAGIDGGYLASPHLAKVHWQAGDRPLPPPEVTVAGEVRSWVDPAGIPSEDDIAKLGQALAAGAHGDRDELMANTAAYSGLRWGELPALTIAQVDQALRVITVDRKAIEVGGRLYIEAPKNRKHRRTIYPLRTPAGYPLAERLSCRIEEARAEQEAGTNPTGLIFPTPTGKHWRSSNFSRSVLKPAYLAAGWRDADGKGTWTWHSLRHVFCTTALFTWKLDATDVSVMAGHANVRTTLLMYVGATAGVLDRAARLPNNPGVPAPARLTAAKNTAISVESHAMPRLPGRHTKRQTGACLTTSAMRMRSECLEVLPTVFCGIEHDEIGADPAMPLTRNARLALVTSPSLAADRFAASEELDELRRSVLAFLDENGAAVGQGLFEERVDLHGAVEGICLGVASQPGSDLQGARRAGGEVHRHAFKRTPSSATTADSGTTASAAVAIG
jgi:integrase